MQKSIYFTFCKDYNEVIRPIDEQLAGIDFALYGDKNNNPDNSIVIFNRNGEITKKEFSEEQMKYLKKFISSLTDEDYPDL